jgi:hypothetical protein
MPLRNPAHGRKASARRYVQRAFRRQELNPSQPTWRLPQRSSGIGTFPDGLDWVAAPSRRFVMIRALAIVSFATFLVFGLAASGVGADQQATFESLDKNSDDKVSINEAAVDDHLFVAFKSLDGDKDGELTRDEFARYEEPKAGA